MAKQRPKALQASKNFTFPDEIYQLNQATSNYKYTPYPEVQQDDKVILIGKFFDKMVCDYLIRAVVNSNVMESFSQPGTREYAARFNDRFSIVDRRLAEVLWGRLRDCLLQDSFVSEELRFSRAKGLNTQFRVYRYEKGHHFGKHYDESVNVPDMGTTEWTLLIYLSGDADLIGGDTIFYSAYDNVPTSVHPSKGLALLHKHGDDCLLHEAQLVEKGIKWVLRSDVVF